LGLTLERQHQIVFADGESNLDRALQVIGVDDFRCGLKSPVLHELTEQRRRSRSGFAKTECLAVGHAPGARSSDEDYRLKCAIC
jgi:hypothetical protein